MHTHILKFVSSDWIDNLWRDTYIILKYKTW